MALDGVLDRMKALRGGRLADLVVDTTARLRMLATSTRRQVLEASGAGPAASRDALVARFRDVQRALTCAHSIEESLYILDVALRHRDVAGDLVECGVYKGGMTAKLSLLGGALDRRIYAYDSYEGLPDPVSYGTGDQIPTYTRKLRRGERYRGGLAEVRANVARWGDLGRCVFVKGWFSESFGRADGHPRAIAFAFLDVDLTRSLGECLAFVWPRVAVGGIVFCHEARDPEMVGEIERQGLLAWPHEGVGTGLGPDMPNLCWIRKTAVERR